jgi:hypothetical protein
MPRFELAYNNTGTNGATKEAQTARLERSIGRDSGRDNCGGPSGKLFLCGSST